MERDFDAASAYAEREVTDVDVSASARRVVPRRPQEAHVLVS